MAPSISIQSLDGYKTRREITITWYKERKIKCLLLRGKTQRLVPGRLEGFHEDPKDPTPNKPKALASPDWSDVGNPELRVGNPALGGPWGWKEDRNPVFGIDEIERNLLCCGLSSVLYCRE